VDYFTVTLVQSATGSTTSKTTQNTTGAAAGSMQWTDIGSGAGKLTVKVSAHNAIGNGPTADTAPKAVSCWDGAVPK
jgi:titin